MRAYEVEACIAEQAFVSKKQLEAELADARLLHKLSIQLIQEDATAGLYKKIVERHHGTIQAERTKDVGAAFTTMLPLQYPVKNPVSSFS